MSGAVALLERYKRGFFYSHEFVGESSWNGYERNCLFANLGAGEFADAARALGVDAEEDGRGVAVADLDVDGRLDLVVVNSGAAPAIFLNRLSGAGRWLALELEGAAPNLDAVGAEVRVEIDGATLTRWVGAGDGFATQSSYVLHFGLGDAAAIDAIEVRWPDGRVDRIGGDAAEPIEMDRVLLLTREAPGVAARSGAEG